MSQPFMIAAPKAGYINNLLNYANRDCVILHKGDTIPVQITASIAAQGWQGGQFARWVADPNGSPSPTVDIADGRYCGIFVFGSDESGDQFTAMTNQNQTYQYVSLFFGGNILYTRVFETYEYNGRHGIGPLVPLVYTPNNPLYISENGKITPEDESNMVMYGGPVANHTFPDGSPILLRFVFFGSCMVAPSAATNNYLGVQTNFGV
jgi:hypothetical protein